MAVAVADPAKDAVAVARALLSLAKSAGMPDSFFATDRRVRRAFAVIERYAPPRPASRKKRQQYCLGSRTDATPMRSKMLPSQAYCAVCWRSFTVEVDGHIPRHVSKPVREHRRAFKEYP